MTEDVETLLTWIAIFTFVIAGELGSIAFALRGIRDELKDMNREPINHA